MRISVNNFEDNLSLTEKVGTYRYILLRLRLLVLKFYYRYFQLA